ncbi:MAG: PAS domain S-box protein [Desulfarculus sp.]|nr:PAS domain S-box protein [Desulfarculus sp.]
MPDTPTLLASAEDLRQLGRFLAGSPIAFAAVHEDGSLLTCNQAFCDLLGFSLPEIGELNLLTQLTPPPWRGVTRQAHDRLRAGGPPQPFEKEFLRRDGETVPVELFVHQVVDQASGERFFWSFVNDISDRRRAEARIREGEARYRAMVEAIEGLVYVCSQDQRIEFMNQKLIDRLGRDATGEPCHQALPDLEPAIPPGVGQAVLRGETMRWEAHSPRDGRWFYVVNTPIVHLDGKVSTQVVLSDITARKQAEQGLRESEQQFRTLTETAASAILIIQDDHFRYSNPAASALCGYSPAEISQFHFLDLVHPEHRDLVSKRHAARLRGEKAPVRYQFRILTKSGEPRWIDFTAGFIEYQGRPAVLGTALDVTEQRLAMETLLNSERRLADLISFLPDPAFAVDVHGKVIAWTRAMEELTGVRSEDIMGKGDYEYALPFYGQRRPVLVDLCLHWNEDDAKRYPFITRDNHTLLTEVELTRLRPGGVVLWAKATPLYDSQGGVVGAIETIRDITAHKRLETELRDLAEKRQALVNSLPLGVISVDDQFRITELNAQGEVILGISQDQALGRHCWEVLKGAPCHDRCPIRNVLSGHQEFAPMETVIHHPQRGPVPVRLSAARLQDAEGRTIGGVEVFQDISELKALERERGNIVSMFAHDMKSPLVSIQGFALRLLSEAARSGGERQNKYLDIIRKEAAKLEALVNDFLDFSRLELGRLTLNFSATDLSKELLELVEVYQERFDQAGISLTANLDENLPVIEADAPRLRRVFTNLLENALKYSSGGTSVRLEAEQTDGEILVRVRDQGIGIAAEELPFIFDVFYRGKNKGQRQGHGLGLAGAEAIVRGHGGRVLVASELGRGSVFTVALPKRRPEPVSVPPLPPPPAGPPSPGA